MPTTNCAETTVLLRRALDRDDEAWNLLVLEHDGRLKRLARILLDRRLQARFDPEDIVQETFAEAFLRLKEFFEQPMSFQAWLNQRLRDRIVRLKREHLRARCRTVRRESGAFRRADFSGLDLVAYLPDSGTSPSGGAMRVEDGDVLRAAFPALEEPDREILELFYIEGHRGPEIGAILDLSREAVRKRLERAVSRLTALLRRTHPEWCHAFETAAKRAM